MSKFDYDLIVIGAGAAGLTSSTMAAGLGAKTLLVEKEKELGGDCLHYGCVPSKALIKSAYCSHIINHSSEYGLPDIKMPPVEFKAIAARIRKVIASIQVHDSPEHLKKKYKVETKFGAAKFLDAHTIEVGREKITSKKFIIATGSSPAVPPVDGIKDVPYLTNMTVFSLETLPESMIVLGGGPIGLEMAQAFARLGTQVTVVEYFGQILAKEDDDVALFMKQRLEQENIKFLLKSKAVKAWQENGSIHLNVECDGKMQTIKAQQILVAAGRKANVEGLDLEQAGVVYEKRGIKVNDRLRTSASHIYACGDVRGLYQFTHMAGHEASIAVLNALFPVVNLLPVKANYKYVPWCTYLDPEVASIGHNEKSAREAGIFFSVHKEEIKINDRAKAEGETEGFVKILTNGNGRTIGVQIVGFHAGELLHEWVPVLNGNMSLFTLSNAIHAYPTLSEINKTASLNCFLKAPNLQKLRMILNI